MRDDRALSRERAHAQGGGPIGSLPETLRGLARMNDAKRDEAVRTKDFHAMRFYEGCAEAFRHAANLTDEDEVMPFAE